MARKEKSNYTVESVKRKYTKPGRPKKLLPDKKDNSPKKDNIPKLNPLDSSKLVPNRKDSLPKLNPLDPSKLVAEKKELPKLSPFVPKLTNDVHNTNVVNTQKLDKYAGMPKLTPIVEILQPKFSHPINSANKSVNDESHSKKLEEPFLKPNLVKPKKDRVKPRVPTNARKITKENVLEG